jgi:hypothetical protein
VNGSSWDYGAGASYVWERPMMSGPAPPPTNSDKLTEPPSQSGTPNRPLCAEALIDQAC